jgi:hypothetical protein
MVVFSGFYESHEEPPPLGDVRGIVHRCIAMAITMASKVGTCCIIVVLIVALEADRAIRSE